MKEYKLLTERKAESMPRLINMYAKDGWEVQGQISYTDRPDVWYVTMVREVVPTEVSGWPRLSSGGKIEVESCSLRMTQD